MCVTHAEELARMKRAIQSRDALNIPFTSKHEAPWFGLR